jgi:hypothetical protein
MHRDVGRRLLQGLEVRVDGHELDPGDLRLDHAVDRVHARAPDTHHADHRQLRARRPVIVPEAGLVTPVDRPLDLVRLVGEDAAQALLRLGRCGPALLDPVGAHALGVGRVGIGPVDLGSRLRPGG